MLCTFTLLLNLLILTCYVSVSSHSKMAMFGQRFILIIVEIIKYFIIVRFPILRSDDGSDELWHFLLLQGMSGSIMMATLDISLFSRLTRAGLTPPCWMSSLLSRTMKSVRLSAVCVSKTTFIIHRKNDVLNIQDKAGCEGWTWTDEDNTALHNECILYSDFGRTISYPHCVR